MSLVTELTFKKKKDKMRKLVTVQTIKEVLPIENADLIERVRVLGWNVVTGKGEFKAGDKVAYFEIDTLLPETDSRYEKLQKRGQKTITVNGREVRGHVLSSIKLRGIVSQGLVMDLAELGFSDAQIEALSDGEDVSHMAGIFKYEEPVPMNAGIVGPFDKNFAPKSDAMRAQSLSDYWDEIIRLKWVPSVKVDGSSHTIINDNGNIRIFGRNWELDIDSSGGYVIAKNAGIVDVVQESPGMAVQFEYVGPGVQRNRLKLDKNQAIVFAVWLNGEKVPSEDWDERLVKVATPVLDESWKPQGTLDEMIEKVSTLRGSVTKDVLDEGIVYHLASGQETPHWMDRNANFKIINNKYLLKHGI